MQKKKNNTLKEIIKSCRFKIILLTAGLLAIIAYRILIGIPNACDVFYHNIIQQVHEKLACLCDKTHFSVAEILIAIAVISIVSYTVHSIIEIIRKKNIISVLCKLAITYIMYFTVIYGGFCILWGVYYSVTDLGVSNVCNITTEGNTHDKLILVDEYFVNMANEYSIKVLRDDSGCCTINQSSVLNYSYNLFDAVAKTFPGLDATKHYAKGVNASVIMSYMDFTGFFFPFTAEANINIDSPDCMIPSTIAHEIAHQRGIAREDEANFVAVLACIEDGDPDYVYSASLLALIHLQNALYKSGDKEEWQRIRDMYNDEVLADLRQNSAYWEPFRKSVAYKATNSTYDAFLKSYDQEMGIETYGACVDYLIEYYSHYIE